MAVSHLPEGFSDLEPLVEEWSLASQQERAVKRVYTDIETLKAFYAAVRPRIHDMIGHLNRLPNDPNSLPPDAKALYHLAQMFMEVSAPIDLGWPTGDIEDTFPMERFEFLMT